MKPYELYADQAKAAADRRWGSHEKYYIVLVGIAGLLVALYLQHKGEIGPGQEYLLIFAFLGAGLGYLLSRASTLGDAAASADTRYANDWCDEQGLHYRGSHSHPSNAPLAYAGVERKATNAVVGEMNGLQTLFYNFRYTNLNAQGAEFYNQFMIMRLKGPELPVSRMTLQRRGVLDRSAVIDSIQEIFSNEQSVSMESMSFNSEWDLTIDKAADQTWIRRVFDPATITSLVNNEIEIPSFYYYDRCWWFVEAGRFEVKDLDQWILRQKLAADAVKLLSRVQNY